VASGQKIRVLTGHSEWVSSVSFSPGGKQLASSSYDGTVKLWGIHSDKELATLISVGENDWAVTTPNGYFDCSEGTKDYVHFVRGTEVIELDQFFETFYHPGLLATVMSGGELPDIDAGEQLNNSPPPTVEIISPVVGEKMQQREIEIQVKVCNKGGGIDEVKLLHNKKRIPDTSNERQDGDCLIKTYTVSLGVGDNTFVASAFSAERVESRGHKLDVHFSGAVREAVSHVLAIGIDEYKNPQLKLNYARTDAESFVEVIRAKSSRLFTDVNVTTLYDTEATRENILTTLDQIAAKANPEDVFTLYYAGHGSIVDNRYYFVTTENIKLYDRAKLDRDATFVNDMQQKLTAIPAKKVLVIMDACHSGAAADLLAVRGAAEEKALAQLARNVGVHVLASSGSEQYASEFAQLGHGVFTYVLLKGLQGEADMLKDGQVTVKELGLYIENETPKIAKQYKGQEQYPTTRHDGQDFPLVLE